MNIQHFLNTLASISTVSRDLHEPGKGYVVEFRSGVTVVQVSILFDDFLTGAELAITRITTLPKNQRRLGYGSAAVKTLLLLARKHGAEEILATLVQKNSESFWKQNGFELLDSEINHFHHVFG